MPRPLMLYVDEAKYARLEKLAAEQKTSIEELMLGRGVDALLGDLDADLPRAAAELVAQLPWADLERFVAVVQALRAVRQALPVKPR